MFAEGRVCVGLWELDAWFPRQTLLCCRLLLPSALCLSSLRASPDSHQISGEPVYSLACDLVD